MRLTREERQTLWNNWSQYSHHEQCQGLIMIDSGVPGPHLCVSGAIHGNESVGAIVLEALLKYSQSNMLISKGKLSLLFGNPDAFLAGQRYLDEDLNRSFAESKELKRSTQDHLTTDQLADEENQKTHREIKRQDEICRFLDHNPVDFLIDLHSISRGDMSIVVYPKSCVQWGKKIGCVDIHFCYEEEHMIGRTLIDEVALRGGGAVVVECGHHHSPHTVSIALAHVQRMLDYFEVFNGDDLTSPLPPPKHITCYHSIQMIRPRRGFRFIRPVETGSQVQRDEIFAVDDFGSHSAYQSAWFMMPSLHVGPHDQDAGWLCSRTFL